MEVGTGEIKAAHTSIYVEAFLKAQTKSTGEKN